MTGRNWDLLHLLVAEVEPGEWTTYGELSDAIGSAPIAVGQHLARCPQCANPWRVIASHGRPVAPASCADRARTCQAVLEEEGLRFDASGTADPAAHVSVDELRLRAASRA